MKNFIIITPLLFFSFLTAQNKIDLLQTNKEVSKFLSQHINPRYTYYRIFNRKETANAFLKNDLDFNGLNDLIVESESEPYHMVILNLGNNVYKCLEYEEKQDFLNVGNLDTIVQKGYQKLLIYKTPVYKEDLDFIPDQRNIVQEKVTTKQEWNYFNMDTLTIKYQELVPYQNKQLIPFKINKIELEFEDCYWNCPSFKLTIQPNFEVSYLKTSDPLQTTYDTIINPYRFKELEHLSAYLHLPELAYIPSYLINDGQVITLKINHNNNKEVYLTNYTGQIKQQDYYALYKKLMAIRDELLKANGELPPDHHDIYYEREMN